MQASNPIGSAAPRVLVFMTARTVPDIPGTDHPLACLLPLGTATFAERLMDSCAQAGLREIDLVVSEHPESLRERLGDGSRWGLRLHWHLAKETATPYTVLQGLHLPGNERVLLGHGHRWVSERVLRTLAQHNGVAMHLDESSCWTGWLSMDSLAVPTFTPHADYEALSKIARAMSSHGCVIAHGQEFAKADSAKELMQAQQTSLQDMSADTVPASWLRMPWGAMSPDAVVDPHARLTGPILIGADCMVAREAQIGPDTVLTRNVLVADGAVVQNSLVLPNTYVGSGITLDHAVAQGNSVQHLKWAVRTTLADEDAMLMPLVRTAQRVAPWSGRCVAILFAAALAPFYFLLVAAQALRGRPRSWTSMQAVTRRSEDSGKLHYCTVRQHRPDAGRIGWLLGCYGALLDVAQGRRNWFGVRPRDASQWYALGRDWQMLFDRAALGFFHAPAWMDNSQAVDTESLAAADVYLAVNTSLRQRGAIFLALARSHLRRHAL